MKLSISRRRLLKRLAMGASLPVALSFERALAADAPLISANAPEAKAVQYVEDAKNAKAAKPGNTCANCALYQGASGSAQGACQLFNGKFVKAVGWCNAWQAQM
jgi:hypothetical protein